MQKMLLYILVLFSPILLFPQTSQSREGKIADCYGVATSQPLYEIAKNKVTRVSGWKNGLVPNKKKGPIGFLNKSKSTESIIDPGLQEKMGFRQPASPIVNFDGMNNISGYLPPDQNGAVNANYYVQSINSSVQIFNKAGASVLGPFDLGVLWQSLPGPWSASLNDGDPIVLYDQIAGRWLISEFSLPNYPTGPFYELVAISKTSDPTGQYYVYAFTFDKMPDYPHFGIWPDGYYLSVNQFAKSATSTDVVWAGAKVCVLERSAMLLGQTARMASVSFTADDPEWAFLPSDFDGTQPAAGTPNYFCYYNDNAWGAASDVINVFEFNMNWTTGTPAFTGPTVLPVNSVSVADITINQPGTTNKLDPINDRLLHRLQYRKFSDHESIVANHTVNVSGKAAVRWYELRKTTGAWSIYQQGTYNPDASHRWMGSIAMDGQGNIALGYSVSSSTVYPSIRYTGRLNNDPLGTMTVAEGTIMAGLGSQTGTVDRWGDYTSMSVDPTDDQTFWYTNEYYKQNSNSAWQTRIASLKLGTTSTGPCLAVAPSIVNATAAAGIYDVDVSTTCGGTLNWTATEQSDWISLLSPTMNRLQIVVLPNISSQSRSATVTIAQTSATNSPLTVTVNQAAGTSGTTASIVGYVKDATSDLYLAGVTVNVGDLTTTTDNNGYYALNDVPLGLLTAAFTASPTSGYAPLTVQFTDQSTDNLLTLQASKTGYIPYSNNQISIIAGETKTIDIALSPVILGEGMRFVLNWGERPWDLDSHLKTPSIDGTAYHIDYTNQGDSLAPPFATLDVDNTEGYGPETVTIQKFYNGTYYYFVHNYSDWDEGDTTLKNSGALVQVYTKDGLQKTIKCPFTGEGYYWHVCNVDGTTKAVTIINQILVNEPGPVIPSKAFAAKKIKTNHRTNSPLNISGVTSWLWNFGDNTSSTLQNPSHQYTIPNTYSVSLTVGNGSGQKTLIKTDYIVVSTQTAAITITGTVKLADNTPVSGVQMTYTSGSISDYTTTNSAGQYTITVYAGWTGVVTPTKTGYTFTPTQKSYTTISANQVNQDYVCAPVGNNASIVPVVPATTNAGSDLWVDITVGSPNTVSNLFGLSLELNYLKTYLTFVSAETGPFLGAASDLVFFSSNDATNGKVAIGITKKAPATGSNGTGVVIRVKFTVSSSTPNNTVAGFTLTNVSGINSTGGIVPLTPVASSTNIISGLSVWPGDNNNDGIVNQNDVLPLGLYWAKTGAARANASLTWTAQLCTPWSPTISTYADGNGDGIVNQADVTPIGFNWNKTHTVLEQNKPLAFSQSVLTVDKITSAAKEINVGLKLNVKDADVKNISGIAFVTDYSSSPTIDAVQVNSGSYFSGTMISYANTEKDVKKVSFGTAVIQKQNQNSDASSIVNLKISMTDLKGKLSLTLSDIYLVTEEGNYFRLNDANINLNVTDVLDKETVKSFSLIQNYPNPFNPSTVIEYRVPKDSYIQLKVFNTLGQEIQTLVNERKPAGQYRIEFNASTLPSGVYIYRITTENYTELKKMIFQK